MQVRLAGTRAQLRCELPRRPRPRPQLPVCKTGPRLPLSRWVQGTCTWGGQPYERHLHLFVNGQVRTTRSGGCSVKTLWVFLLWASLQEHELQPALSLGAWTLWMPAFALTASDALTLSPRCKLVITYPPHSSVPKHTHRDINLCSHDEMLVNIQLEGFRLH